VSEDGAFALLGDDEMSDEKQDPPVVEKPTEPQPSEAAGFEDWLKGQPESVQTKYAEHTGGLKSALDAERAKAKEADKLKKKLAEYETAEQKRKEAELSETEKLAAENKRLQAELEQRKMTDLKRTIAAEFGLPEALATRLQGDDEDAMRADAEQLKAAFPAAEEPGKPKPKPKIMPTNPGDNAAVGETPDQRNARIYGGGSDIFNPVEAARHGGGVLFGSALEKED
jgi:hypothetical protein